MTFRALLTRAGALVGLATLVTGGWLLLAAPAGAAPTEEWEIKSFDAVVSVATDGSLQVAETIEVEFHVASRGIYREVPFRVPVDRETVRLLEFDQISVGTTSQAAADLHQERAGDYLVWRIGDPDVYLTGEHTYTISYRVRGALNQFDTHDELFWNVTGDRWEVPIQQVSATVHAPAISKVSCFAGVTGGTDPCAQASADGTTATFTADPLPPGSQLDVVVAMPPGAVDVPPPEPAPANLLVHVFQADPARIGGAALVTLLGLAGVAGVVWRRRDAPATATAGALPGGVEYRPPDDLRPAELRTLLSQWADQASLAATVVDLAVRGHLRIEEVAEPSGQQKPQKPQDWVIHRRQAPADDLRPYEQEVLVGLFPDPDEAADSAKPSSVQVSKLRTGTFHSHYQRMIKQLYEDVVERGFYRRDPSHARTMFALLAGSVVAVGGLAVAAMLVLEAPFGLLVAPVPVLGLIMLGFTGMAPRRTVQGAAMNRRVQGFREFIRTAEADRMEFAEREQIFAGYLPYAMAFDCVDRWVKAFEGIGMPAEAATRTWYVGLTPMDFSRVIASVSALRLQLGGSMSHVPSSGSGSSGFLSGAFSDGGFGSSGSGSSGSSSDGFSDGGGGGGGRW